MRALAVATLAASPLAVGCASPEPRVSRLRLALPSALSCRANTLRRVEARPLGDMPAAETAPRRLFESGRLDPVSPRTEHISVAAVDIDDFEVFGVAPLPPGSHQSRTLLLPLGASCPLGDPEAAAAAGAVALALPDGRLWVAGGAPSGGAATRRVFVLAPGAELVDDPRERWLFVARTRGSATLLAPGDRALVAGGTSADSEGLPPLDTFEIHRVEAPAGPAQIGFMAEARKDHAAALLPDGRVLLAGGAGADGRALSSFEVIDPEGLASAAQGSLAQPRMHAQALRAQDGSLLLVGGLDREGNPVDGAERWLPGEGRFVSFALPFSARRDAVHLGLEDGSILQVGGRDRGGAWVADLDVALAPALARRDWEGYSLALPSALRRPAAAPMGDGRVWVLGEAADGSPVAWAVDIGRGRVQAQPVSRSAHRLIRLSDGSWVELGREGISRRRFGTWTALDPPPEVIFPAFAEDEAFVRQDGPHWELGRDAFWVARLEGARLYIPRLRFRSAEVEIEVQGRLRVRLLQDGQAPRTIDVTDDENQLDDCQRPHDGTVRIAWDARTIELGGAGTAPCTNRQQLSRRAGIAIEAARGAGIRSIRIRRRF